MKQKQNKTKTLSFVFQQVVLQFKFVVPPCPKTPVWFPESILFTGVTTIFGSVQRNWLQSGERYGFDTWSVELTASCQRTFGWGSLKNLWADFFSSPGRRPFNVPFDILICFFPYLLLSPQSQRSCISTMSAAGEKWVSPMSNTARHLLFYLSPLWRSYHWLVVQSYPV